MAEQSLPSELLLDIFQDYLDAPALASLCRASRRFRDIAEPILYGHPVSLSGKRKIICFIKALLARPGLADLVRALDLTWTSSTFEERERDASFHQFYVRGPFQFSKMDREMQAEGAFWHSGEPPNSSPISAAEARDMYPGFIYALREGTTCAFVVLLLDMLPNLQELVVRPSCIEYWFWASLPNPYDLERPKQLPKGLASIQSLEVRYAAIGDEDVFVSHMNEGQGFAHIKIICALLLPGLRRLLFSGDEGDEELWHEHYTDDSVDGEGEPLDMAILSACSTVTDLQLVDSPIHDELLVDILSMMSAPEVIYYEQFEEFGYEYLDAFVATPSLRSLSVIEYGEWDIESREPDFSPSTAVRHANNLRHLTVPIQALSASVKDDLSRSVPTALETLDVKFQSAAQLHEYMPCLAAYLAGGHRRGLRRLTVRPAPLEADATEFRNACASSGIEFYAAPCIERPEELCDPRAGGSDEDDYSYGDYNDYDDYDDDDYEDDSEDDAEDDYEDEDEDEDL